MNNVVATGHHASDVITNVRELFGILRTLRQEKSREGG
jgi:hypothetical protein